MKTGCLLIHGWTGAPFEMEPLVTPLHSMGLDTRLVTLPGHGTTFRDFCTTWFSDWAAGAERAYEAYAQEVDRVVVMGLSMGGTLSLHLAAKYPVAAVVTMAAPVYVYKLFPPRMKDWRLPLVPMLKHIRPVWPGQPRRAEAQALAPWQGYDEGTSLPQLHSLMRGVREVAKELPQVTAPLLCMHCPTDRTAPAGSAWEIANKVSSRVRRVELIPIQERITAHHMLTTHVETRDRVAGLVCTFLRELEKM